MQWYVITLIVVASVLVLYTLVSYVVAHILLKQVLFAEGRSYELSRNIQITQEHMDMDVFDKWAKHPMDITTVEGYKLHAMYIINPNEGNIDGRRKVAIVSHGHICSHIHSFKYALPFYNLGYSIVLYDQRKFGQSEGDMSTLGIKETGDLNTVIKQTKAIFGDNCYLALHGESMGCATVLNSLQYNEQSVAMVVADCGFSNFYSQLWATCWYEGHYPSFPAVPMAVAIAKRKYNLDIKGFNPIESVKSVNIPICYIHGSLDKLVLPVNSSNMFAVSNNALCQLHVFEGAVHARTHLFDGAKYDKIVTDFITLVEGEYNEINRN